MMQNIEYITKKKHYIAQITQLNIRGLKFYNNRKNILPEHEIRQELWNSDLWREAKQLLMEFNEFIFGELTCEYCFKSFYAKNTFKACQIHHKLTYNWSCIFTPGDAIVIHKHCHKQIHGR